MTITIRLAHAFVRLAAIGACVLAARRLLVAGCGKEAPKAPARPPTEVTALTVAPRGRAGHRRSTSRRRRARRPSTSRRAFRASSTSASTPKARSSRPARCCSRWTRSRSRRRSTPRRPRCSATRRRSRSRRRTSRAPSRSPQQNALSQKDLDDAQGQYEQAAAAVAQAKAQLESAKLDLSYTTITSPVDGVSSFAAVADGTYVNPQNSQLTTVSVLTPMWINFSVSENEMERIRNEVQKGLIRLPEGNEFVVEIELVDGTLFPYNGQDHVRRPVVQLADRNVPDPRVGRQSRRACCGRTSTCARGFGRDPARTRSSCRSAPCSRARRATSSGCQQGQNKAELRPVVVGDWYGDELVHRAGPRGRRPVVVDGALRLAPDAPVKATAYAPKPGFAARPRRATRGRPERRWS